VEIIRIRIRNKGSGKEKDRDRGKLSEFVECRRGVFSVTDVICPRVRQH